MPRCGETAVNLVQVLLLLTLDSKLTLNFYVDLSKQHYCIREFMCVYVCVCTCAQTLSHVQLFATPWTVAHQAPLSMGFPRQEYWNALPWDLPEPRTEHMSTLSPALQTGSLPLSHLAIPLWNMYHMLNQKRNMDATLLAVQWLRFHFWCRVCRFNPWLRS